MLCLVRRATQFLELLQATKELNNLERDVLNYLQTPHFLALQLFMVRYMLIWMILMKLTKLSEMYLDMCVQDPAWPIYSGVSIWAKTLWEKKINQENINWRTMLLTLRSGMMEK